MEVTPVVMEMRPVVGVAISVAMAAAMEDPRRTITATPEHRRGTKATAVNCAASEPAAVKRSPAAPEPTAVKATTAATEAAAMKATATTAEAAASTAPETATAAAAMLDFSRQPVGCKFR
jgi:hypothetical protein